MAQTPADVELDHLTAAVTALDPQPRERRWTSLTFCIVDAVWSIQASYSAVVVPLVGRVATSFGVEEPSVFASEPVDADPVPLSVFLEEFDLPALTACTNRQVTSTRGGILKADAVLQYARVFADHGVETLAQAQDLFDDTTAFATVDAALRRIRGEGGHGIRRGYLWMLVGDTDRVKPDRMVLRWFRHHGAALTPDGAAATIAELVVRLNNRTGERHVNAWEVDHAIWRAGQDLPA